MPYARSLPKFANPDLNEFKIYAKVLSSIPITLPSYLYSVCKCRWDPDLWAWQTYKRAIAHDRKHCKCGCKSKSKTIKMF